MKKKIIITIAMMLIAIFCAAACGSDDVDDDVTIESIELNTYSISLEVGEEFTLIATVVAEPDTEANKKVNWTSDNTSAATVDSNGKVKAVGAGEATIIATSKKDSDQSVSCHVVVEAPASDSSRVADIKAAYITAGYSESLEATYAETMTLLKQTYQMLGVEIDGVMKSGMPYEVLYIFYSTNASTLNTIKTTYEAATYQTKLTGNHLIISFAVGASSNFVPFDTVLAS